MKDFIPTRASQIKANPTNNYISVNYETRKKKTKLTDNSDHKEKDAKIKKNPAELRILQEKEMKKARYDIIKFGMSGFEKVKARKAKVELAISLGAFPPKNRKKNYKILKLHQEKKKERIKKEQHMSGFANSLHKPKSKIHKKNPGILGVYGKMSKSLPSKQKN